MNLFPTVSKLYPEGSYGGQCARFTEKLTDHPLVGYTIASKRAAIAKYGINRAMIGPLQVGDVVVTSDGLVGHTFLVNSKPTPSTSMATESNWYLNLRIHHSRLVSDNDPHIIGVFRGRKLKFPVPPETPQYNMNLRIKLVMNQPDWKSLNKHAFNIVNWFYTHSGGHILPVVDWVYTDLKDYPTEFTGPVIGGLNVERIKESWIDQNVMPLAQGFDVVLFVMKRSEWHGTVFDHPELMELGYAYEKVNGTFPGKAMLISDEHDDYPPYYPDLGAFAKLACHEIIHLLYGVALKDNFPEGSDLAHNHFYGTSPHPEDCFDDLDYEKLSQKLGH